MFLAQRAQLVHVVLQRKSFLPRFFLSMSARSTRSTPHQVEKNSLGSVAAAEQAVFESSPREPLGSPRLRSQGPLSLNPNAPSFAPSSSRRSTAPALAPLPQVHAAPAVSAPAEVLNSAPAPPSLASIE